MVVQAFDPWLASGDAGKTAEYLYMAEEAESLILAKLGAGRDKA
jgi:hypothetical protein